MCVLQSIQRLRQRRIPNRPRAPVGGGEEDNAEEVHDGDGRGEGEDDPEDVEQRGVARGEEVLGPFEELVELLLRHLAVLEHVLLHEAHGPLREHRESSFSMIGFIVWILVWSQLVLLVVFLRKLPKWLNSGSSASVQVLLYSVLLETTSRPQPARAPRGWGRRTPRCSG